MATDPNKPSGLQLEPLDSAAPTLASTGPARFTVDTRTLPTRRKGAERRSEVRLEEPRRKGGDRRPRKPWDTTG